MPGTYTATEAVVTIAAFAPQLHVITSKQRPRKLTIHGSDGAEYMFLLKVGALWLGMIFVCPHRPSVQLRRDQHLESPYVGKSGANGHQKGAHDDVDQSWARCHPLLAEDVLTAPSSAPCISTLSQPS